MEKLDFALTEAARRLKENRVNQAETIIRESLAAHPDNPDTPEALRLRGGIARAKGSPEEAEHFLRRAITLSPRSALAHADLCSLLCDLNRTDEAMALLDHAAATQDSPAWTHSLKAATRMAERRPREALPDLEALTSKAPHAPVAWINLAEALQAIGDLDGAVGAYRRALAIDPHCAPAWLGLTSLRVIHFTPEDTVVLEAAFNRASSKLAQVQLGYALGKALGDQDVFEASFLRYEQANLLRGASSTYDPLAFEACIEAMGRLPTSRAASSKPAQPTPVFIVGMPRSGSTLVEQILACHPQVEALGELFQLPETAGRIETSLEHLPAAMRTLSEKQLSAIGEHYLSTTRRFRRTERAYFTDKMPANWQLVPLIRRILPHAKIIDVRRDRLPCCISIFTTYFNSQAQVPAKPSDLMRHYDIYREFMDRMRREHVNDIHLVRYENLILHPEKEVRGILDYLNLDYISDCLRPDQADRPVFTPSAQQVRKPIGNPGIQICKDYETMFLSAT